MVTTQAYSRHGQTRTDVLYLVRVAPLPLGFTRLHLIYKLDIEDLDGVSARSLVMAGMAEMVSSAATVVKQAATQQGKAARKVERSKCSNCGTLESPGKKHDKCARCKQAVYCNRKCQGKYG